jgi:hypothetical protein
MRNSNKESGHIEGTDVILVTSMDLKELRYERVTHVESVGISGLPAFVNTAMNLRVSWKAGNFLTS